MSGLIRLVASLRLSMLAFCVPYAWLWAGAADSGGTLMVVAHALLVLCYFVNFTDATIDAGQDPRLSLLRDRVMYSRRATEIGRHAIAGLTVIVGVLLLISQFWVGVAVLVVLGLILVTRGGLTRRKLELAEIVTPAAMLVAPMVLIHRFSRGAAKAAEEKAVEGADAVIRLSDHAMAATWLGAIMLAVFVLMTLLRDEPSDRGLGLRTTVTLLGRTPATVFLFVWLSLAMVLAVWGSTHAMWDWKVGVVTSVASAMAAWTVAARVEGYGVALWWVAHATVAFMLMS